MSKIVRYYHIKGDNNPADILTKFLLHHKWWLLMKPFLHWIELDEDGNTQDESNGGGVNRNSTRSVVDLLGSKGEQLGAQIWGYCPTYCPTFRRVHASST